MEPVLPVAAPIRSALFVDFDNIYIGLSKSDPAAAERFASDPARWLNWLERGLPVANGAAPRPRSILIRRCYPNPDAGFRRFRSYFTSAAFSVIDCPSMTRNGKNSSDIYMVMDILDTLNHKTNFDEFIIFSGDSDFMPVLLRLRAHDRRTTTFAIDFMPPAYKAACDLVINEEEFIEDALGLNVDTGCGGAARSRVAAPTLKAMASRVYEATRSAGEVSGADLPEILKDFREFRDSTNWLGFGTSQRLAEALACSEPRLRIVRINGAMYSIGLAAPTITVAEAPRRTTTVPRNMPGRVVRPTRSLRENAPAPRSERSEIANLRAEIARLVRALVAEASSPILLAKASQHVVSHLGQQVLDTQWAGTGSFKRLLQSMSDLELEITTQPEPGYIFDPARHVHPSAMQHTPASADAAAADGAVAQAKQHEPYLHGDEDDEEGAYETSPLPTLEELILRVNRVTGAPDLSSREYATTFQGIVHELHAIAAGEKTYNTYQSSKSVSDWCETHGMTISRGDVVLIFKGIIFQDGVRFAKRPGSYTEADLAHVVLNNLRALCQRSRLELSDYEDHLLEEWILGGLEPADPSAQEPQSSADYVDEPGMPGE